MNMLQYLIIIEGAAGSNYSAYAPDLPGCVATGETHEECQREMRDVVTFHLAGLREAGEPVPEPSEVTAAFISVAA